MRFFLFLAILPLVATGNPDPECQKWFKKTGIDSHSRSCFQECFIGRAQLFPECSGQCDELCTPDIKISLFFGNGMFNTYREATRSLSMLTKQVYPFLKEKFPSTLRFLAPASSARVAYNTNELWLEQFLQVVDQKMNHQWENFLLYLNGINATPEWFQLALLNVSKNMHESSWWKDKDLPVQVRGYQAHVSAGDAILVVAHSQGNFYRDGAFFQLDRLNGFPKVARYASVSVATPTGRAPNGRTPEGEWYTTLFSDNFIRSIPGAMRPNVKNTPSGIWDHSFVESYLQGSGSGPKIMEDVACSLSKLNEAIISPSLREYSDGCHPFEE